MVIPNPEAIRLLVPTLTAFIPLPIRPPNTFAAPPFAAVAANVVPPDATALPAVTAAVPNLNALDAILLTFFQPSPEDILIFNKDDISLLRHLAAAAAPINATSCKTPLKALFANCF